jgi:hypothetical protein
LEQDWKALVARSDQLKGIRDKPVGGEPADEAEHFYTCGTVGSRVDKRDLLAALHHEQEEREALPVS